MVNSTWCKVWASSEEVQPLPTETFLTAYMIILALAVFSLLVKVRTLGPQDIQRLLREAGVALNKVAQTAKEIERKIFHLLGLLVPVIYQICLLYRFERLTCIGIVTTLTFLGTSCDYVRIKVPYVQENWPLKYILRENEKKQFCGSTYFSWGCNLAIVLFDPVIAMTSIIFLVLGDLMAALIGRSFGQSICCVRIGPGGRKSVEGSVAMFLCCFIFGCTIFSEVHLREYAVFVASLVATLTELYEPLGINDNVSIPVFSSLALTCGFARTFSCEPTRSPLLWYSQNAG